MTEHWNRRGERVCTCEPQAPDELCPWHGRPVWEWAEIVEKYDKAFMDIRGYLSGMEGLPVPQSQIFATVRRLMNDAQGVES